MAETLAAQLTRVQKAIATLESGTVSSVTIQGRTVTFNNLQTLYDREQQLIQRTEDGNGMQRRIAEM